jgi:hypothetical protein
MRWVSPAVLVILAMAWSLHAVIEVKVTIAQMHQRVAREIIVAKVTGIDAERRLIEADVVEMIKGDGPGKLVKLQVVQPEGLIKRVKVGDPMVLFVGAARGTAAPGVSAHLADIWLTGTALPAQAGAYRAVQPSDELRATFPGRTEALVKLLIDMKQGRAHFPSMIEKRIFRDGVREAGRIDAKVTNAVALDANDDGKLDLAVVTESGVKVMLGDGVRFGQPAALDGIEKHPRVQPLLSAQGKDRCIGKWGDDDRDYVMLVSGDGIRREPMDAKGESADFLRLTGGRLEAYAAFKDGPKAFSVGTLDVDGDGRMDLLVSTDKGPLLLVNRGYGAFLVNPFLREVLGENTPGPATVWTAADLASDKYDDLIIIREDGTVMVAGNPPYPRPQ